jgi:sugar-specific transcriptional regulator TrmB
MNENQAKIRLAVWQYRLSPASQIGALTGMERTHAYKILLQLQEKNLIASSLRGKTSYFYVPDKSVLRSLIDQKYQDLKLNEKNLDTLETELDTLINPEQSLVPPIRQWTGNRGVEEGLQDTIKECQKS